MCGCVRGREPHGSQPGLAGLGLALEEQGREMGRANPTYRVQVLDALRKANSALEAEFEGAPLNVTQLSNL